MDELKRQEKIQELERQIAGLPIGYISKKTINGKVRYYHQWTENRKKHSQYLRDGEMEALREQIERRKFLQAQLKELQSGVPKVRQPKLDFETSVIAGRGLEAMSQGVKDWGLRDCFEQLEEYLYSKESDRVCLIFGLRRTGKTTMLRQAIGRMAKENLSRTAYIKARRTDNMAMMNRDLKKLFNAGFRYVFIDEVTLMEDFIDSAALFSDVFATMGMKIVLSGTDSLGFWLAMDEELYDRAKSIHTTFIPYREYSRLLGIDSIDEYIRYGGTLRAGELAFDDEDVNAQDASFRDDESTRRYIADIKAYKPENKSIVSGQILQYPYPFEKARLVIQEMADALALELVDKRLATNQLVLTVGYDIENLKGTVYTGEVTTDRYGRKIPKHAHGTVNLDGYTSSGEELLKAATSLYDRIVDKTLLARRLTLCANHLLDESSVPEDLPEQIDLFTDYSAKEKQKKEADTAHARERKLQETMLGIKKRFGKNAILKGLNLEDGATAKERNNQIGGHKA